MIKSREELLYNAVLAWLVNYKDTASDLTPEYIKLEKELKFEYEGKLNEQSSDTKTQERGRSAKKQRTQKASSNPSSTEKNKTTNQET